MNELNKKKRLRLYSGDLFILVINNSGFKDEYETYTHSLK